MGSETVCVPLSWQHTIDWYAMPKAFDLKIVAEGPWKGILESKRAGKYQPTRFSVTGSVDVKLGTTPLLCSLELHLALYYLGRGGRELEVASHTFSGGDVWHGSAEYTLNLDKSFDAYTEWRGPGLQGFKLHGEVWDVMSLCGYSVEVSGRICMTLTWVD